ncbi:MAG: glycosyltransferase family 4 protein [bacterium]
MNDTAASAGSVLMLVQNYFPHDPRVRNEAYTLARNGYKVTVLALKGKGEKSRETVEGVRVYRVPQPSLFERASTAKGNGAASLPRRLLQAAAYVLQYAYFTGLGALVSPILLLREGFDVIHVHNPPDTMFVIGAAYKLLGKKFVFDHHDLSPELYISRFGKGSDLIRRGLLMAERLSLKVADLSIATNESYRGIQIARGKRKPEAVYVVRNGPDLATVRRVAPDERLKSLGKHILGYLGAMNPQDGVDYLLRSLKRLRFDLGRDDFYCVLIGSGDSLEALKQLSIELGIQDHVRFTGYIDHEEKLRYLSAAEICVDPDPSSPLNDVSTWIKVMEYMALGKPVVSFDLKETRYTAREAALYVCPNDERAFAEAIAHLMDHPEEREKMGELGARRIREELAWEHVSKNLLAAYRILIPRRAAASFQPV